MKISLSLLLLIPSVLAGQERAALPSEVVFEIRSVEPTRVLDVAIKVEGGLFGSLGVLRLARGQVSCGPSGCMVSTPAVLALTLRPGEGYLAVPDLSPEIEVTVVAVEAPQRRVVARGHSLIFSRDELGQFHVRATHIQSRF